MNVIDKFIKDVIAKEGGYTNNPDDKGGPTNWGITKDVAYAHGYRGDMAEFTRSEAEAIYKEEFWLKPKFDRIALIDESMAEMLLNFGVLAGQQTASKMLQRALNVLNHNGVDYPDIKADGNIGPITIHAVDIFVGKRGSEGKKVLRGMLAAQFSVHLMECAERNPKNEEFQYGWQLNRVIGAFL